MNRRSAPAFWWQVRVTGHVNLEKLSPMLFELHATGLVEEVSGIAAYFKGDAFASEAEISNRIATRMESTLAIDVSRLPAEDWDTEWKKNFKPTRVSRRIVVRPSWESYRKKKDDLVVVIDPQMSFGTGTHESTRLAMRLTEKYLAKGDRVLDVGTGTGILAIASAKLGAGRIFACDIDDYSISNARENFRKNRVEKKISLKLGTVDQLPQSWPKTYTAILANIQRTVILGMMPSLYKRLVPGGILIVAGILNEEASILRQSFTSYGLMETDALIDGEWTAFALRRPS
jgi:ribosomal protein L11 methyltransferase